MKRPGYRTTELVVVLLTAGLGCVGAYFFGADVAAVGLASFAWVGGKYCDGRSRTKVGHAGLPLRRQ